jgi:hypothetical protein
VLESQGAAPASAVDRLPTDSLEWAPQLGRILTAALEVEQPFSPVGSPPAVMSPFVCQPFSNELGPEQCTEPARREAELQKTAHIRSQGETSGKDASTSGQETVRGHHTGISRFVGDGRMVAQRAILPEPGLQTELGSQHRHETDAGGTRKSKAQILEASLADAPGVGLPEIKVQQRT